MTTQLMGAPCRAETTYGPVVGRRSGPVLAFLGLPYAAAPRGRRRFAPPAPRAPWTEALDCTRPGAIGPQVVTPVDQLIGAAGLAQDEDCLNLNIWTPGLEGERPVMVWVHGGSFSMGTGSAPMFEGTNLAAANDVVVVTVNYRLGLLGFFPVVGERLGEPYQGAANAGLLDVVAALEWIARNIDCFGGDPANVTLMGESAGGTLVGLATALTAGRGLVRRYLVESSGFHVVHTAEEARRIGERALQHLGIPRNETHRLFDLPVEALLEAQGALSADFMTAIFESDYTFAARTPIQPAVDGVVVTEDPHRLIAQIPPETELLLGVNSDEMLFTAQYWPSFLGQDEARLQRRADAIFAGLGPDGGRRALDAYRAARPKATIDDLWIAIQNDAWLNLPSRRLALAHPGPVYAYLFTYPSNIEGGKLGAYHGMEMPFAFNNLDTEAASRLIGEIRNDARDIAAVMSATWAAFARTGRPAHPAIPPWPRWEAPDRLTMELGVRPRVISGPYEPEREIWDQMDTLPR